MTAASLMVDANEMPIDLVNHAFPGGKDFQNATGQKKLGGSLTAHRVAQRGHLFLKRKAKGYGLRRRNTPLTELSL